MKNESEDLAQVAQEVVARGIAKAHGICVHYDVVDFQEDLQYLNEKAGYEVYESR